MKAILVTGANKGIGLAIVTKLLEDFPDTYILLGSRNVARGREALQHVVRKLGYEGKNRVDLLQIDVTSDESMSNLGTNIFGRNIFWGQWTDKQMVKQAKSQVGSPLKIKSS